MLKLYLPHYWEYQFPEPNHSLPNGTTVNGHPWIGATNPTLTIEEFSDYQCFQCAKMHLYLRQLVSDNPKTLRLVHRNYPMDNEVNPYIAPDPFHVGSARLALLSIAAMNQNKFWQVNDVILKVVREKKGLIDIREIANQAQADSKALAETIYAKQTIKTLETDIRDGLRHKITGTPTYVINGEVYIGSLPKMIFKELNK
jgi:protein-disulfide isomerase